MTEAINDLPDGIEALRAALIAERMARREAEARAVGAEAMVAHLKLLIAKARHDRFGASAERGRKLIDQMELELEELEANLTEDMVAAEAVADLGTACHTPRRKPVRGPLPAHLPRERVVIPAPSACPCCGGALVKLGESVTESLESIPRQWKVIQTVREKFACRAREAVTQPPAEPAPAKGGCTRSRAAAPGRICWRRSSTPNSAITCHSTDRARPTRARALRSMSPR